MEAVLETLRPGSPPKDDWPDRLAQALDRDEVPSLRSWAAAVGLRPTSVSRGFALAYGVSPQRFRADRRACRAVQTLALRRQPLALLAAELGYADQAHMSREIRRLTGAPPARWRAAQEKCVQEEPQPG
jgi:AraC-like DNA-binding protein